MTKTERVMLSSANYGLLGPLLILLGGQNLMSGDATGHERGRVKR